MLAIYAKLLWIAMAKMTTSVFLQRSHGVHLCGLKQLQDLNHPCEAFISVHLHIVAQLNLQASQQ